MSQPNADELLERAMELPAGERLALATELIESVDGPDDADWNKAWAAEMDRRVRELDAGSASTIPWERVKEDIVARLRTK